MALGWPSSPVKKQLLKCVLVTVGFFAILFACAAIMRALEEPNERADNTAKAETVRTVNDWYTRVRQEVTNCGGNLTLIDEFEPLRELLEGTQVGTNNWNFIGSLFFWYTVMTTIGYGTFTPLTSGGRTFTSIMCVFCVGYFGYFLSVMTVGSRLLVKAMWHRCAKGSKENATKLRSWIEIALWLLLNVTLILVFALIATLASVHGPRATQSFTYGEAMYMSIISFTTIGFGDYAPDPNGTLPIIAMFMITIGLWSFANCIAGISDLFLGGEEKDTPPSASPAAADGGLYPGIETFWEQPTSLPFTLPPPTPTVYPSPRPRDATILPPPFHMEHHKH